MAEALAIGNGYRLLMQPAKPDGDATEPLDRRRDLIARTRTGDVDAFDQLMQIEQDRVLRVARRLLVVPDDAPDAVQEVFMRIYRSIGSYKPSQEWSPWLYRIAVNVCRDLDRKRRWRRLLSWESWKETQPDSVSPIPSPLAETLRAECRRLVAEGLRRLPPKERAALVLRDIEGLTAARAAAALGSSEATVRSHASRGRAKLRDYVRRRGGLE